MSGSRDDEAARFDVRGAVTGVDVDESLDAPICLMLSTFRLAVMRMVAHPLNRPRRALAFDGRCSLTRRGFSRWGVD
jgi:hypothetical protein